MHPCQKDPKWRLFCCVFLLLVPLCCAALKAQLPPDAADALKAAAAATAEQQLQRYHAHLHEAQQQLLEWELGLDQQQQRQQQAQSASGGSGSGNLGASSAAGCSTAAVAAGSAAPSAAELTMQQLVARLAQRDVRVDETQTGDGPRCAKPAEA